MKTSFRESYLSIGAGDAPPTHQIVSPRRSFLGERERGREMRERQEERDERERGLSEMCLVTLSLECVFLSLKV